MAQNTAPQRNNEESDVATCLWAMQRKLDPGTDVYLVPYGGKVGPILSPQGVIKLIMRSGYAKAVNARPVFDGETFDYLLGSEQWVKHKKANKRTLAVKDSRGQVAANSAAWEAPALDIDALRAALVHALPYCYEAADQTVQCPECDACWWDVPEGIDEDWHAPGCKLFAVRVMVGVSQPVRKRSRPPGAAESS